MKKNEIEFITRIVTAVRRCPELAGVVTDSHAAFVAARDFQKVTYLACVALESYTNYCAFEKHLDGDEYDVDWIKEQKVRVDDTLVEFEDFVAERAAKGWE